MQAEAQNECDVNELEENDDIVSEDEDFHMHGEKRKKRKDQNKHTKKTRSYLDIGNAAEYAVRCNVSSAATAGVINGFLKDLIAGGFISKDKFYLCVDRNKVDRAKSEVISTASKESNSYLERNSVHGIFVDGRKDDTLFYFQHEESNKLYHKIIKEYHMTVTEEPNGAYIHHYTPEAKTLVLKPAKQAALGLHRWMLEHGIDQDIEMVGSDTTNEMSGPDGGVITLLEGLLERRVFRVFCQLHVNELPWRHLITNLDGKTSSTDHWSGPVARLFSSVDDLPKLMFFQPIQLLEPLITIPEAIVQKMSQDSKLAWQLVIAITTGMT